MIKNFLSWISTPIPIEHELINALKSDPIDIQKLRNLSENGFEDESWRRKIWPKLLGISKNKEREVKIQSLHTNKVNHEIEASQLNQENHIQNQTQDLDELNSSVHSNDSSNIDTSSSVSPQPTRESRIRNLMRRISTKTNSSIETNINEIPKFKRTPDMEELILHQEDQINKDVERSLWAYTINDTDAERNYKRKQLKRIIVHCLHERKNVLYYFQGLHDICTVFFMVCGEHTSKIIMEKLVDSYFFDSTHSQSMDTILNLLKLIHELIKYQDIEVANKMEQSGIHEGHYALSWVLTWFSHVIEDLSLISRLFDTFLCHHPIFIIYFSACFVLHIYRDKILEEETDFATQYSILNRFKTPTEEQLVEIIQTSSTLFKRLPPLLLLKKYLLSTQGIEFLNANDKLSISVSLINSNGRSTPRKDLENRISDEELKLVIKELKLKNYFYVYPYEYTKAKISPDVKEIHKILNQKYISTFSSKRVTRKSNSKQIAERIGKIIKRKEVLSALAGIAIIFVAVYFYPNQK